jgi:prenylcysteine oxidase/farnesylcysteine lyase
MFEALGLFKMTQVDAKSFLMQHWVSELYIDEFVDAISRVNYGQRSELNAFVDSVSLIGAGMSGHLWSVEQGNSVVVEQLIKKYADAIHLGTLVKRIEHDPLANKFTIHSEKTLSGLTQSQPFDVVVIATPIETSDIQFNVNCFSASATRKFVKTHVTFVNGKVNPRLFNSANDVPDIIVNLERESSLPFRSLSVHAILEDGSFIYKLFSDSVLADAQIGRIFSPIIEVQRFSYKAYPYLEPTPIWPEFEILPGLFYLNAMESAVSCMETEAVAGKNVAVLVNAYSSKVL